MGKISLKINEKLSVKLLKIQLTFRNENKKRVNKIKATIRNSTH